MVKSMKVADLQRTLLSLDDANNQERGCSYKLLLAYGTPSLQRGEVNVPCHLLQNPVLLALVHALDCTVVYALLPPPLVDRGVLSFGDGVIDAAVQGNSA